MEENTVSMVALSKVIDRLFDWVTKTGESGNVPSELEEFSKDFQKKSDYLYKTLLLERVLSLHSLLHVLRQFETEAISQKLSELDADQLLRYYKEIQKTFFDTLDLVRKTFVFNEAERVSDEELDEMKRLLLSLPGEVFEELRQFSQK